MQSREKPVILLVAEAVTLAHFARIISLAESLSGPSYQIVVASDPRYTNLAPALDCQFHSIWSISSDEFANSLARGKPLYTTETLTRYVESDLALLDAVAPDLVIGDFRLSLAISAPLRGVPYASIVNAYWSPYAQITYPVPDLPFTRFTGLALGQTVFNLVRSFAFASHARPLNEVRRHCGLTAIGKDLRRTYTWGDYTLYADIPELVPMRALPQNHRFLGPILWSTQTALPDWWTMLRDNKPIVFVTLGSSGRADLLPFVLSVLAQLPVTVIAATAGKIAIKDLQPNVYVADYLPMDIASARAALVVTNGGSLTTYQALTAGVPVIGICSNMDQLLNMSGLERMGAGLMLRAARLSVTGLKEAVTRALADDTYVLSARRWGQALLQYDPRERIREFVAEVLR